jgi:hypothetical protein
VDVDTQAKAVAKRVISNSNYASLYFGYFEASTDFLSANDGRLDHDAEQMLLMLRVGLPRLSALCLCRLWDKPGKDRHSLLALTKIITFAKAAGARDQSFIRECRKLSNSELISGLTRFRNTDLAHNLPLPVKGEGLTIERLREILRKTQPMIDRVASILRMPEIHQDEAFQLLMRNGQGFWDLVAHVVVRKRSRNE